MNKAIFFDRDGTLIKSKTINGKLVAIRNIQDLEIFPDAEIVLSKIKIRGYKLVLITNQPDVSRGLTTKFFVEQVNSILKTHLSLDLVKVAFKSEKEDPFRYKPGIGMLLEASKELNIDLSKSFVVGDRWRDIEAGKNAGCKTILFRSQDIEVINTKPDFIINSLFEILDLIY